MCHKKRGDWANTKATYNFWQSKRFESEDIIDAHQKQTAERAAPEKLILAIQDTSDFNFTHHPEKTWEKGLGMTCAQKYVRGLKVHSIMASTAQGVPLGILDQQIWTRNPKILKKKQKAKSSILNKESKRWLTGLVTTELAIPSTTTVVRLLTEKEISMSCLPSTEKRSSELLIRAKHNRRIAHELKSVKQAIAQTPSRGQIVISVPRKDDQPTREATLTVRHASFTVLAPSNRPKTAKRQEITLNVISAREENPPTGSRPINWLLLTTLEVENFEQAIRCIRWYTYRASH